MRPPLGEMLALSHSTKWSPCSAKVRGRRGSDPSLVFLAQANGTTVGYIVSFLLEMCGYVGSLGVLKQWRRHGIGTALLRRAFAELAGRGSREVRLGVDTQNVHGAVAVYEGVGVSVYRRYDTFDIGTSEAAEQTGIAGAS
jgi:ribosomal protein S18 acetylase RimI-like enzyme